ncbi:EAL domain-containing protein (putative c-di-GMP-specific phosphodiesterase class I) [Psychrobacter sp. PL19]
MDFIEAIIEYKLSFRLFYQMVVKIAQQLSIWQALGFTQHICINAEATEFNYPEFFDVVSNLFKEHNIRPQQLHVEVTESSLMRRHANVKHQLTMLKEMGIRLALDDFGTGYASLSYLQEYPFDFIKIDRSFISKIATDRTQYAIVKAILDLADALDMEVVAEGIETEQQRDLLLQMGCAYGQGYWFGRPVNAEDATEMLTRQHASK